MLSYGIVKQNTPANCAAVRKKGRIGNLQPISGSVPNQEAEMLNERLLVHPQGRGRVGQQQLAQSRDQPTTIQTQTSSCRSFGMLRKSATTSSQRPMLVIQTSDLILNEDGAYSHNSWHGPDFIGELDRFAASRWRAANASF